MQWGFLREVMEAEMLNLPNILEVTEYLSRTHVYI